MKTFITKLSMLSLVLSMGLVSCTEEDGTGTGGDKNNVTELSANSHSSTSVNVRWLGGSASDTLIATAGANVLRFTGVTSATIDNKTYYMARATGLAPNTNYVFSVNNAAGTSAGTITWAGAMRWPSEANPDATVQLWETADPSPNHPSGLIIDGTGISAISTESADSASIDMVLAWNDPTTAPGNQGVPVSLVSPGITGSGIIVNKRTYFGNAAYNVAGGLDNDYYTAPVTSLITTGNGGITGVDLAPRAAGSEALNTSLIVPFLTEDGHYGRIELVPDPVTGQVYTSVAGIESIKVRVSYQTQANTGYVGRGTVRGPQVRNNLNSSNAIMKH